METKESKRQGNKYSITGLKLHSSIENLTNCIEPIQAERSFSSGSLLLNIKSKKE
jgi:hypothetical protein